MAMKSSPPIDASKITVPNKKPISEATSAAETPVAEATGVMETGSPKGIHNSVEPLADDVLAKSVQAQAEDTSLPSIMHDSLPSEIKGAFYFVRGTDDKIYGVVRDAKNPEAIQVGSPRLRKLIKRLFFKRGQLLTSKDLNELDELLLAHGEELPEKHLISLRVAPIEGGVEIDLADDANTRIRLSAGKVEILTSGSEVYFQRSPVTLPMVMPAETGDLSLLAKYVNLDPLDLTLFRAWLAYTLAHPKVSTSNYVFLVISGDQGTGKTSLCRNVILALLDPNQVGVQSFPGNATELAIATQHAHVLCFDNMRNFRASMSDQLCGISSGTTTSKRQLYTNTGLSFMRQHCPIVLNGIHQFINQSDLAQRCLTVTTEPIAEADRLSEKDMVAGLQADLPVIFRGLLDLIAQIYLRLPEAKVVHPERMIEFCRWLAAMELVDSAPVGAYQQLYSESLRSAQYDSLQENLLASAVLSLAQDLDDLDWTGTPATLLKALENHSAVGSRYAKDWPSSPIALSKRLKGLKASLATQGIRIDFGRGKERRITIAVDEELPGGPAPS